MKVAAFIFGCVLSACLVPPVEGQQNPETKPNPRSSPWWVAGGMGAGQISLSSDQQHGNGVTTFALGFSGGYQPANWLRFGLLVNGWQLQADNLIDPTVGEDVGNVGGVVDIFPLRRSGLFARGGYGLSKYSINRPLGINGSGPGWEAGGGYEIPIHGRIRLVPTVAYAAGNLGNGSSDTKPIETGLHYSVIDFKLSVVGNFGPRRR